MCVPAVKDSVHFVLISRVFLFLRFHGLEDVRMVEGNHDVAFVDYHTEAESGKAMQALHGFNMGDGCLIRVSFAKR